MFCTALRNISKHTEMVLNEQWRRNQAQILPWSEHGVIVMLITINVLCCPRMGPVPILAPYLPLCTWPLVYITWRISCIWTKCSSGVKCVEFLITNTLHHTIVYIQITFLQSVIYTFRLKLNIQVKSQVNGSLEPHRVYSFYFAGEFKKMVLKEIPTDNITRPLGRNEVIGLLFRLTIFGAVTYFTIKWMVDAIDPTRKQKLEAQKQVCLLI